MDIDSYLSSVLLLRLSRVTGWYWCYPLHLLDYLADLSIYLSIWLTRDGQWCPASRPGPGQPPVAPPEDPRVLPLRAVVGPAGRRALVTSLAGLLLEGTQETLQRATNIANFL